MVSMAACDTANLGSIPSDHTIYTPPVGQTRVFETCSAWFNSTGEYQIKV